MKWLQPVEEPYTMLVCWWLQYYPNEYLGALRTPTTSWSRILTCRISKCMYVLDMKP